MRRCVCVVGAVAFRRRVSVSNYPVCNYLSPVVKVDETLLAAFLQNALGDFSSAARFQDVPPTRAVGFLSIIGLLLVCTIESQLSPKIERNVRYANTRDGCNWNESSIHGTLSLMYSRNDSESLPVRLPIQ